MINDRPQSFPEEIANSATHGLGALLSLAAIPLLVVVAATGGDAWQIAGAAIFGATLLMLYTTSTLYHALPGALFKTVIGIRMPHLSTALYLAMGWLIVVAAAPLVRSVPGAGIAWLLAGGLCYTGGVVFYVLDARMRYAHAVWHLFVLAGSAVHFWAVYAYTLPRVA